MQDSLPAHIIRSLNSFGSRIGDVRVKRGVSVRGIQKLTDNHISPTGLYKIEVSDRWPSAATLLILAQAYDCDIKITRRGEIKIYGTGLRMEEDS